MEKAATRHTPNLKHIIQTTRQQSELSAISHQA